MSKQHRLFTSFLPGVSADAVKRMRKVVRGWRIPRQTPATLAELAQQYNSVIRGWWEYYGAFYQTAMRRALSIYRSQARAVGQTQIQDAVAAQAAQRWNGSPG